MIQVSMVGWLMFAALLALSCTLGARCARLYPWAASFQRRELQIAVGVALAPFILGLAGVLALALLPGVSHRAHFLTVVALLAALVVLLAKVPGSRPAEAPSEEHGWSVALFAIVGAYAVVLVVDAVALPLVQSDALEYATAGRRLFTMRTLAAYPPIDAVGDSSGFYGPWTHPPLYAALIYLANVCQGQADAPGLMRLLSPWALVSATAVVYALGATRSRRLGLLAALLLISTPSLLLGADSSQIDAFAVLGFALVLAGCVGAETEGWRGAIGLGGLVGIAMWSHSQAILFLPLAVSGLVVHGSSRDVVQIAKRAAVVAGVALVVGAWPYVANFVRMGVIISDNPAVFSLPQLGWPEFFRSERALDSAQSRIQYGILKGWTAVDAFGLTFWLMTMGAVSIAMRWRKGMHPETLERVALAMLACYFAGVVASAIAGIDLMIKSERYFLVIMPAVVLVAAIAVAAVRMRGMLVAIVAFYIALLPVLFLYRLRRIGLTPTEVTLPLGDKLARWTPFQAMDALQKRADSGLVLSLKPSDMFYSGRKMVSYLDPRMVPIYQDTNPGAMARHLREMGVVRAHIPNYSIPPLYNSALERVLADPSLTDLEFSRGGYQLYRLVRPGETPSTLCPAREIGPGSVAWHFATGFAPGGAKRMLRFERSPGLLSPGAAPMTRPLLFQRERPTLLSSSRVPLPADRSREMLLRIDVAGRGFARVAVQQQGPNRTFPSEELGGTYVTDAKGRSFSRRFVRHSEADALVAFVEFSGASEISLRGASLSCVHTNGMNTSD